MQSGFQLFFIKYLSQSSHFAHKNNSQTHFYYYMCGVLSFLNSTMFKISNIEASIHMVNFLDKLTT